MIVNLATIEEEMIWIVGNRLTETKGIYQYSNAYDAENRLTNMTLFITKPNIISVHWWQWNYDANGNQVAQTVINGTTGPLYSYDYECTACENIEGV